MARSTELSQRARNLSKSAYNDFWSLVVECSEILKSISPNRRKLWLSNIIEELYHKQQGKCALCSTPLDPGKYDVDHKIPFCYGGGNERSNIQLAHPSCNRSKRAEVDPHDLLLYLEDRYMNL